MGKTGLQSWLKGLAILVPELDLLLDSRMLWSLFFPQNPSDKLLKKSLSAFFICFFLDQKQRADIGRGWSEVCPVARISCLSVVYFLWMWSLFYFEERLIYFFRNRWSHLPFIIFYRSAIIFIAMFIVFIFFTRPIICWGGLCRILLSE